MVDESNVKYCPECGCSNEVNSDFCGECGFCLKDINEEIPYAQPTQPIQYVQHNNKNLVIIIVAFICVVLGIGSVGYFYLKSNVLGDKNSDAEVLIETVAETTTQTNATTSIPQTPKEERVNEEKIDMESEYILPRSDREIINTKSLTYLSERELMLARNEIYARHGREFQTEWMQEYFDSCSWYVINQYYNYNNEDSMLNSIELQNIRIITDYENSLK